ncbi:hypothetical protein NLJ89_g3788 [Agrocybe chaxingu]|uniref:Protein kinase domain-containing protein n=1 Tax=Agrocybe chaxingu TaxID=84603 RepID=A0A9W8MX32_9AGAR|nr:hypothetical protein NLJ89_g3788 [Agrocybe chaxingu]
MATLQVIWRDGLTSDHLRAWDRGQVNQVARMTKTIQRNIYIADLGPVAEPPTNKIVAKLAYGKDRLKLLEREYTYYTTLLAPLQGTVVPYCYGLFKGTVKGREMGCLLLEYIKPHTDKRIDTDEFHRELMVALCKIHQAGLKHGNLKSSHILQMGYSPRIVDFSLAEDHKCEKAHPANIYGEQVMAYGVYDCDELRRLEIFHGVDPSGIVMQHRYGTWDMHRMSLTGDSHTPVRPPGVSFYEDDCLAERRDSHIRSPVRYPVTPYPFEDIRLAEREDENARSQRGMYGRRPTVPPPLNLNESPPRSAPAQVPAHANVKRVYQVDPMTLRGAYIYKF